MSTERLMTLLGMFAQLSGQTVSRPLLEFTARKLAPLGVDAVCNVLEGMLETGRRFPTVAEVKAAMGLGEASDESKARDAGERIWSAISRFGWINGSGESAQRKIAEVSAFIGPIGDEVVKLQGGWNRICETATNDNAGMLKAQWRELALVLVQKSRRGEVDKPPQFGQLPERVRREMKTIEAHFTPYKDD